MNTSIDDSLSGSASVKYADTLIKFRFDRGVTEGRNEEQKTTKLAGHRPMDDSVLETPSHEFLTFSHSTGGFHADWNSLND